MTWNELEHEVVAVGVSVAAGCRPCTHYHVRKAREAGATDETLMRVADVAVAVRHRAADSMLEFARSEIAPHAPHAQTTLDPGPLSPRILHFTRVGASFAVNCTATLKEHLAAATRSGMTPDELSKLIELAELIKGKAASHVQRLAERAQSEGVGRGEIQTH